MKVGCYPTLLSQKMKFTCYFPPEGVSGLGKPPTLRWHREQLWMLKKCRYHAEERKHTAQRIGEAENQRLHNLWALSRSVCFNQNTIGASVSGEIASDKLIEATRSRPDAAEPTRIFSALPKGSSAWHKWGYPGRTFTNMSPVRNHKMFLTQFPVRINMPPAGLVSDEKGRGGDFSSKSHSQVLWLVSEQEMSAVDCKGHVCTSLKTTLPM